MSAHAYHPHCGCASCCDNEEADERRDDHINALLADSTWRARAVVEADAIVDGTHDGSWYSEAERALADLDGIEPADLLGKDVLATLYRLAKIAGAARKKELREIAEREADAWRHAA